MTKKIKWRIFAICIAIILVLAIPATFIVIHFVKRQKEAYTGYDGYVWYGTKRSSKLSDKKLVDEFVFEHTLEVAGTMAKYFRGDYLDLSSSYIALLPYYKEYSKMVIFSEMNISNITIYCGYQSLH